MANDDLIYRNRLVTMLNEQKQCEGFPDPWYEGYNTALEVAITIIEHMPFVYAVCPNCGAKMDLEECDVKQ